MLAVRFVKGLAGTAVSAVRHPVSTAGQVAGRAKGVVSTGASVASAGRSATARLVAQPKKGPAGEEAAPWSHSPQAADAAAATEATETPLAADVQAAAEAVEEAPAEVTPMPVMRDPAPPLEPPVDIVEQVLAAEEEDEPPHYGHATEPKAASRDEEHGDAALQRAEAEEIAEEVAEAFPAGAVDVETPVGTTGADVGFNPDTAEADLQQPGTAPLVDDATVKAVAAETTTGRKAARPKKKA